MGKEQTMMLAYSNAHPAQIGYYWFKADDEYKRPLILEVLYGNSQRNTFVAWNGHCYIQVDRFKGAWSNRIPEPDA